ncbi:MAG TPA: type II toxin-antitoxin system HicB family antitoxin [Ktedonobacterales bacterium]|nr:type II toxin-antitoxin system HicB family antitoxin [Ktedonobacterales bacterium]
MPRYVIIIEPGKHNYSAYVPDVPGVAATGATIGEVTDELRDALEFHLEGLQLAGEPLPEPSVIASAVDVTFPVPTATTKS